MWTTPPLGPGPDETCDSICGVRVLQRAQGYRVSLDPILLAQFAARKRPKGAVIDLGAGSGVISLLLAARFRWKSVTALELQPSLYELATRNVRLNHLEGDVHVVLGDLRDVRLSFPGGAFAHAVCNPPFGARESGWTNPEAERAIARHELTCDVGDVVAAAAYLLASRGKLFVVHPASRLASLIQTLRQHRLEPRRLRLVYPRARSSAHRVLVEAVKEAREGLELLPPLVVHRDDGHFTDELRTML
ncbi:MAG: tRNA1(Val) (adenine(37)-N6)-methyltransferase [Myxococcota bacterium]